MKNLNVDKIKKYLLPAIILFLGALLTTSRVYSLDKKIIVLANVIVVIIEIIMFKFIASIKTKKIELHKIYLILAIVFGIFYIIVFPPSEIPDEMSDYLRILEISKHHLTTKQKGKDVGDYYSKNVKKIANVDNYNDELKTKNLKLTGKKEFMNYANKSLYNFICYIPQTIGIGISSLLNLSIVLQMIFGKIFNYITFVILIYFSIKNIPYKKYLVFFVALLPITLQEATSLAPDSLAISLSIFLISHILMIRAKNETITKKQMIMLLIASIVLSLCKIVYLPLCLLLLLIPKDLYKSKKQYIIYNILVIGISTILNLMWLKYTSKYLIAFPQSNSSEQLKYILAKPISYFATIVYTIEMNLINWIQEIVGRYLGLLNIQTSILLTLPAVYILVKLIAGEKNNKKDEFKILEKIYISLIIMSIVILIFTSLYLQWTPLKSRAIEGIQGRYFIPLLLPLSYIFMKKTKENKINDNLIIFIIFMNVISLVSIIGTFI